MSAADDIERSLSYGTSALVYLKGNHTPAYPRNYELWYTYAAGFNRELNRAVNDALKRHGRVTPELSERLYNEFLSPVHLTDRVGEVSTKVSTELKDVVSLLQRSGESLGSYGESLRNAVTELGDAASAEQISTVVKTVIAATVNVEAQNAALEAQLKDSQHQMRELQESLDAIRFESLTDQLTGLANRKHFDQSLELAIDDANRSGAALSLIMCDIDRFKQFNDTYGHQTGDQVLRLVGAAIKGSVKGRDIAARYGGEEFAVILPDTPLQAAVTVANQIRNAVMTKELIKRSTGESLGRITMSAGIAQFRVSESRESLIERADAGLYASKRAGRNRSTDETDPAVSPRAAAVA